MTRGTRVGMTIAGFLTVFAPVVVVLSAQIAVLVVAATLVVGAVVVLLRHLRDARHPRGGRGVHAPHGAAHPGAEVISLSAFRAERAEPPAAGRLAIVSELSVRRSDRPHRLPLAR